MGAHLKRRDDSGRVLVMTKTDDGDVCLGVIEGAWPVSVQFCTLLGGGRSPRTLRALRALFDAVAADNEADPAGDPR